MESGNVNPTTKHSCKRRNEIYLDKKAHQLAKKADRANRNQQKPRNQNEANKNMSHRGESSGGKGDIMREKKGGQEKILCQEKRKMLGNVQEQDIVKFNTPQKWVLKNKLRQLCRKIPKSSSSSTPDSADKPTESTNRMLVCQSLKGALSP